MFCAVTYKVNVSSAPSDLLRNIYSTNISLCPVILQYNKMHCKYFSVFAVKTERKTCKAVT